MGEQGVFAVTLDDQKSIIVNGTKMPVEGDRLSYEDLVKMANPDANFLDLWTVTHYGGKSENSGILVQGESVAVKDGMVFNVVTTGAA